MPQDHADQLRAVIRASPWMLSVLSAARLRAPDWWVGGGVLRDLVWDGLHGGFDPDRVKDVDLAFYDPLDLSHAREVELERALAAQLPRVTWDAKNQAAVHLWYWRRFGLEVPPLVSAADGVAT